MNKQTLIMDLELRTRGIEASIKGLRQELLNNERGISSDVSSSLAKQLSFVQSKIEGLRTKMPTINSNPKEVESFAKQLADVTEQMNRVRNASENLVIDDKYILKNIDNLGSEVEKLKELQSEYDKLKKSKASYETRISNETQKKLNEKDIRPQTKASGNANAMLELAKRGDTKGIKDYWSSNVSTTNQKKLLDIYEMLIKRSDTAAKKINDVNKAQANINKEAKNVAGNVNKNYSSVVVTMGNIVKEMNGATKSSKDFSNTLKDFAQADNVIGQLSSRMSYMFSAVAIFRKLGQIVRNVFQDFKELDKQFNEIAIVSKYSTAEMWSSFAQVNKMAQEYGVTSNNILEVQNLYYHQGKSMAEVNELTAETLTLAKITGMDYADATNKMTAALNAYKIEAQDASQVTDTVAALSANAATSSEELMTALTKTASIAANAGMSLENTEIFLTKMIETTREAPENLGTALKTIVARFGEVKQEIDGEQVELVDVNKVDKALKVVGLSLLDSAGNMKDLDDVFMSLSAKWDDLDRNTQRYIATLAAGARQQSRFIAMMEDYDRTVELASVAQNSAGTGARQLAKAQESIETAINRLKSTWQEFYSGFLKSGMFKTAIDTLNNVLAAINKLPGALRLVAAGMGLWATKTLVLDRALMTLMVTNKALQNGETELNIREKVNEAMTMKRKNSIFGLIKAKLLEANASEEVIAAEESEVTAFADVEARKTAILKAESEIREGIIQEELIKEESARRAGQNESIKKTAKAMGKEISEEDKDTIAVNKSIIRQNNKKIEQKEKEIERQKAIVEAAKQELIVDEQDLVVEKAEEETNEKELVKEKLKKGDAFKRGFRGGAGRLKEKGKGVVDTGGQYIGGISNAFKQNGSLVKGLNGITKAFTGTAGAAQTFGAALAEAAGAAAPFLLIIVAIIAVIAVLYKLWEKYIKVETSHEEELNKLSDLTSEYNENLKKLKETQEDIATYNKYNERLALTEEQMEDLNEAAKRLVEKYPQLLDYIDEEGNYQLKKAYAIQKALDAQKDATKLSEGAMTSYKLGLAEQGIFDPETYSYNENLKTGAQAVAANLGLDTSLDAKKLSNKMVAKVDGFSWANMWMSQLDEVYESILNGNGVGGKNGLQSLLGGITLSDDQYNAFIENAQGKDLTDRSVLEKVLDNAGIDKSHADDFITRSGDLLGYISDSLSNQADETKRILQDSIYNALDMGDYAVKLTNEQKTRLAEIAANSDKFNAESLDMWMQGATKDQVNAIIDAYEIDDEVWSKLDPSNLNNYLAEKLKGVGIDVGSDMGQALLQSLTAKIEEDEETIEKTAKFLQDKLKMDTSKLTYEQMESYATAVNKLSDVVGENRAQNYIASANSRLEKTFSGDKLTEAQNILLSGNYDSEESIMKIRQQLIGMGMSIQDATSATIDMQGGFANALSTVKELKTEIDETKKSAEALAKLAQGKADFSDIDAITGKLINAGKAKEAAEVLNNVRVAADGSLKMIGSNIQASKNALLKAVDDIGKSTIAEARGAYEAALEYNKTAKENEKKSDDEIQKLYDEYMKARIAATIQHQQIIYAGYEEEKKKLEEEINAIKEFLNFLYGFNVNEGLDNIIAQLDAELSKHEFEIDITTNSESVSRNLQEEINVINDKIAANMAKRSNAQQDQQTYKDVIQKNFSKYINFDDATGVALYDNEAMKELAKKIQNAQIKAATGDIAAQAELAKLQQLKASIDSSYKAYNDALKSEDDADKAIQEGLKKQLELRKKMYENAAKWQETIQKAWENFYQKEIDDTKKRNDRIKKENDKYLNNLQKMVQKERKIRERRNEDEDIKDKEKRLAMMRMDGSGIYSSEIKALEKELEKDYQAREDAYIDDMLEKLQEGYTAEQEEMDKNVEYMQNSLNYKKELYNGFAEEMKQTAEMTDQEVVDFITSTESSYVAGNSQRQWLIRHDLEQTQALGVGSIDAISSEANTELSPALDNLVEKGKDFEDQIEDYADEASASHGEMEGELTSLISYYSSLAVTISNEVNPALETMASKFTAIAEAANSATTAINLMNEAAGTEAPEPTEMTVRRTNHELKADTKATTETYTDPKTGFVYIKLENGSWVHSSAVENGIAKAGKMTYSIVNYDPTKASPTTNTVQHGYQDSGEKSTQKTLGSKGPNIENTTPKAEDGYYVYDKSKNLYIKTTDVYTQGARGYTAYLARPGATLYKKYANGGMVDYTGPAWVDGTKSKPEAFLSAADTENIAKLRDALSIVMNPNSKLSADNSTQKSKSGTENITYNLNITVDEIANDYDVDKMIDRIGDRIDEVTKYRKVTLVQKK